MTRAPFLPLLLGCALLVHGCAERTEPANLLLISIDTLRADHTGLYGYERDTTPNLDAFFAGGTVFERVTASAPCTLPSVPQFLTGSYEIEGGRPLLAEILRERGYATAAVVSQHQFDPSLRRLPKRKRMASLVQRGFDVFDMQQPSELDDLSMTTRSARAVTRGGLAWLDEWDGRRPFFLWLHYFDPHDPYEPPADHRAFDAGNTSQRTGDRRGYLQLERRSPEESWREAGYVFDEADVAHFVNLHDGEIHFTDFEIGRVLAALEAKRLVRSTVVALISDHGEFLGEGGRWDHCTSVLEPELAVPLAIRDRGRPVAGAARVAIPASTVDLVPTLLALLGVGAPDGGFDGVDLRSAGERPLFSAWKNAASVRRGRWKLVRDESVALYDLESDPHETRDRLADEPERGQQLAAELDHFLEAHPALILQNQEIHEQLRELGYVE